MTKNKIKAKAADDKNLQALVCEELSDSESARVVGGLSQPSLKELLADVKAKPIKAESDFDLTKTEFKAVWESDDYCGTKVPGRLPGKGGGVIWGVSRGGETGTL
ncbi:hypothetical protein [Nostoc sp. ChiVER01]|uniref:hypothetical protein n=1 Tax=Nostoc sp. ChiVER01 TaxID=3075382 RepID=UPI002AD1F69D|nr:hypothetical protein [Nostoc sp. ChiVER01]MDZ8223067.1 hypothetical protein [Nostoc sp. ChiVER01]